MIKLIKETIAKGGTVVIPSDSCARVLEISYFLEAAWSRESDSGKKSDSLRNASLYLASASSGLTMRYARSMLEWMDEDVVREFESAAQTGGRQQEGNQQKNPKAPFDFQSLRMIERAKQLNRVLSQGGPKVIIATDLSMEWGFARRLFETISADNRNLLILPEPIIQTATARKNIGHSLWNLWSQKSTTDSQEMTEESLTSIIETDGSPITYSEAHTEKLEGNELIAYQQYLARERQRQRTNNTDKTSTLETGADLINDGSSSSSEESEESDAEHQGKVLNVSTTLAHSRHKLGLTDAELGIDILIRRKGHYDYDVRGKRGRERMFPVMPTKRNPRNDDFGDVIRPEDYLRAEERETVEGQEAMGAKTDKEQTLGQKRRWNEVAAQPNVNGRGASDGMKRHKSNDGFGSDPSRMDIDGVMTNGNAIEDLDDSDDEAEEQQEGPIKAVFGTKTLALHVRIAHVDFSGLHDKRSMQMLIPMIRPRKLVLVGGDEKETLALAAECEKLLGTGINLTADTAAEVLTPSVGQTLDASVDTNAWNVKLSLSLRRQLHWQNVGGLGVVPLTSHLSVVQREEEHEGDNKAKRLKNGNTDVDQAEEDADNEDLTKTVVPLLDIVPANKAAATRIVARPFHVGDLRLSDLRKLMQSQGYPAEFRGEGTLLVNGMVAIRKSAVGKIEVETVLGIPGFSVTDPTFDDVRRRIYEGLLAVVSVS
jgi:cleavage and polyadenylation specificity factor subunit 2